MTYEIDRLAGESGPVRFERIHAWRVAVPMLEPFRISSGAVAVKDAVVIQAWSGEAFGWGESSAMAGAFYSAETPDSCERELIESVLPALAGREFASMAELERWLLESATTPFVRVAVETAAWEILARARGISLRRLFGVADRPVVSGLAVGLYDTLPELRAALERYSFRQYARVKIKIEPGRDVALVRAVREWFGPIPLFVDANAAYTRADLHVFEMLDDYGLMMFEQPFAKEDLATAAELQARVPTPVCLDESAVSAARVREAVERGACRIVNIKLQRLGGYLEAFRVIEECSGLGVPVWMGTMPELGIGSAQAVVVGAHPACAFPTDVEPSARWYTDDLLAPELTLADKCLAAPRGPGLGYAVDEDKLRAYASRHWTFGGSA